MVYLFLANGFEEIEALTPLDVLRRAGVEVTTVGIGGVSVTGAHGIRVEADIPDVMYADAAPEAVILPGGMPGAKNLDESRVVDAAVRAAAKRGAVLAAICAAPMVLGHKGLLNGKTAICYPGFETELTGAEIADTRVVQDRRGDGRGAEICPCPYGDAGRQRKSRRGAEKHSRGLTQNATCVAPFCAKPQKTQHV